MKDIRVDNILTDNRLNLTGKEKLTHYKIVFLSGISSILIIVSYFINESNTNGRRDLLLFGVAMLMVGIFDYFNQKRKLRFEQIKTFLTRGELDEIISKTCMKLDWLKQIETDEIFIAKTEPSYLSGSWGERITIIFGTDELLINSICDPTKSSSITSFGRNRKHVDEIKLEIQKREGGQKQRKYIDRKRQRR